MARWFDDEGLITDGVRSSPRRRTPATRTTSRPPTASRAIARDNVVLLDLWGKTRAPGAVFADISWMGFTGADRAGAGHRRLHAPRATPATPRSA